MHDSHIQNLKTLYANVTRAMRNNETVTISGGTFGWSELCSLRLSIIHMLRQQYDHGDEHSRADLADIVARFERDTAKLCDGAKP